MPNITTNTFHGDFIYKDGVCYEYIGESFGQPTDDNNGIIEFNDCDTCLAGEVSSDSSFAIAFAPPCPSCSAPHSGDPHYTFGSYFHMFDPANPAANINRCSLNVDDNVNSSNELAWFTCTSKSGEVVEIYYSTYDFPFTVGGRSMKTIRIESSISGTTLYDIDEVDDVYTINGTSAGRYVSDSYLMVDDTLDISVSIRTITNACAPGADHLMYSLSIIPTEDWSSSITEVGGALWYIWKKAATFASGPVNNPSEEGIDGLGLFLNGFDGYNQRGDFEVDASDVKEPFSSSVMNSVMNKLNELSQIAGLADFDWDATMAPTCLDEIPTWDSLDMNWAPGELKRFPDDSIHEDHYDAIRVAVEEKGAVNINDGSIYPAFGANNFPSRFSAKMTQFIAQGVMNRIDSILAGTDTKIQYAMYYNNMDDNDWDGKDSPPTLLTMSAILAALGQSRIPASEWETEEWVLQQYDILNRMQWIKMGYFTHQNSNPAEISSSIAGYPGAVSTDRGRVKGRTQNNNNFAGPCHKNLNTFPTLYVDARDLYVAQAVEYEGSTTGCNGGPQGNATHGTGATGGAFGYHLTMSQNARKVFVRYLFENIDAQVDFYGFGEYLIPLFQQTGDPNTYDSFGSGYEFHKFKKFSTKDFIGGDSPATVISDYNIEMTEATTPYPPGLGDSLSNGNGNGIGHWVKDYFTVGKPNFQFFDPEVQGGGSTPDTISSTSSSSSSSSSEIDGGNPCFPNPSVAITITGGTSAYPRWVAGEFVDEGETKLLCPSTYELGTNIPIPGGYYYYGNKYLTGELWEAGNVNTFNGTGIQFQNGIVKSIYTGYYSGTQTNTFNNMMLHTGANDEKGIRLWFEGTPYGGNSQVGSLVASHNINRLNFGSQGTNRVIPNAHFGPSNFGQITLTDGTLITWQRGIGTWGL